MIQSQLVLDDFFDDPERVRERVLKFDWIPRTGDEYHPGQNSTTPLTLPGGDEVFSRILHEPVVGAPEFGHERCRYSLEGDKRGGDVHADLGCIWSGIICLTRNEDIPDGAGTDFFRHKETGSEQAVLSNAEARAYGFADRDDFHKNTVFRDGADRSKWDLIQTVPMRFNRCVIFRPWLWHAGGFDFGTTLENARLVMLLFFKRPPKARA